MSHAYTFNNFHKISKFGSNNNLSLSWAIADIITSIRNADMDRKGMVRIASTNITENIVKILLRLENVRKLVENNKSFLAYDIEGIGKGHIEIELFSI
jgi:ribosomal protein S8